LFIPKGKPNNYYNTWEAVDAFKNREIGGNVELLEYPWELAMMGSWQDNDEWKPERDGYRYMTPVEAFCRWVDEGNIPPPELLACVSRCFSAYKAKAVSGEALSLEEMFFGSLKKGQGSHAQREFLSIRKTDYYPSFHKYISEAEHLNNESTNHTDLAVAYFNERVERDREYQEKVKDEEDSWLKCPPFEPPDIDSFLRGYRRWKKVNQS